MTESMTEFMTLFKLELMTEFLDAIASVGLHMSVGWSVHVLMK